MKKKILFISFCYYYCKNIYIYFIINNSLYNSNTSKLKMFDFKNLGYEIIMPLVTSLYKK